MISANIFDIKRFGVNDGGGIRTVLFIKGCPLKCKWCHNPEGISREIRLWCASAQCVNCGSCVNSCRQGALEGEKTGIRIDTAKCNLCGDCVSTCPTGAIKPDSVNMTVDDAMERLCRDAVFFGENGGITLSGGECAYSPEFSIAVLDQCKKRGINTAIETSMYAQKDIMLELARLSDSVIADIKLIDPIRHKAATGASNALILENFKRLADCCRDLIIRVPLIPGYTDDEENLSGIAAHIKAINPDVCVELINFNPMCEGKYESLRMNFIDCERMKPFSREKMSGFAEIFKDYGINTKGGV